MSVLRTTKLDTFDTWRKNTNVGLREVGDLTKLDSLFRNVTLRLKPTTISGGGVFDVGDVITGTISGATGTVLSFNSTDSTVLLTNITGEFLDSNTQKDMVYVDDPTGFTAGDNVSGSTSGITGKVYAISTRNNLVIVYGADGQFLPNETLVNDDSSGVGAVISSVVEDGYTDTYRGERAGNGSTSYEIETANIDLVTSINEILNGDVLEFNINGVSFSNDTDDTKIIFGSSQLQLEVSDASDLNDGDTVTQEISSGTYVIGEIDAGGITLQSGDNDLVRLINVIEANDETFQVTATGLPGNLLDVTYAEINTAGVTIEDVQYLTDDPHLSYVQSESKYYFYGPTYGNAELEIYNLTVGRDIVAGRNIRGGNRLTMAASGGGVLQSFDDNTATGADLYYDGIANLMYLNRNLSAPIYYPESGTTYYLDLDNAGTSLNAAGTIKGTYSRAEIYYPESGTTYYLDLDNSGTSLKIAGVIDGDLNGKVFVNELTDDFGPYSAIRPAWIATDGSDGYRYIESWTGGIGADFYFNPNIDIFYTPKLEVDTSLTVPIIYPETGTDYYLDLNNNTTSLKMNGNMIIDDYAGVTAKKIIYYNDGANLDDSESIVSIEFTSGGNVDSAEAIQGSINFDKADISADGDILAGISVKSPIYYSESGTTYYLDLDNTVSSLRAAGSLWSEALYVKERISINGDSEITTTDATPATFNIGLLSFPASAMVFTVHVVAKRTDADGEAAAYKFEGCIDNNSGTVDFVTPVSKTVIAEDTAAWDANITVNDAIDTLVLTLTGEAAKTIAWTYKVDTSVAY